MLQFITDNSSHRSVEEQVREVLSAGCRWIQITPDGLTDDRIRKIVEDIMPQCVEHQAFLTFRNHVQLAKDINVGGVIVSPEEEFPSHARATLGAAAIVGVEVNTADQIAALQGLDIDYVAFTPYKSAENSRAPLGISGIADLCRFMESKEMEIPKVASGGVCYDDIAPLMEAGCNGVAMSKEIADADDIAAETAKCLALLKIYEEREQAKLARHK